MYKYLVKKISVFDYVVSIYFNKFISEQPCKAIVFFIFCFTDFFRNKLVSEDDIKIKNKIYSDHFPIELKSKETQLCFLRF